jgi:hypothetical protein
MANPGPASVQTSNYTVLGNNQALVRIASLKGCPVSLAGDILMPLDGAITTFVPTTVVTTNANVTMATATVGIYTAAAQGGTAVLTTAALTGQVSNAFAYVRAATAAAAQVSVGTAQALYINIGTTVATGVVDVYLYGYNVG